MQKTLGALTSNISAACVGGGVFVLSLFLLQLGIPLSCFVGICGYIVTGIWIFPSQSSLSAGWHKESLNSVLKDGERKLTRMRKFPYQIQNYDVRKKIDRICDVAEKIFETVKKNPDDVRTAQQFSSYYLDSTIRIISKYIELSEHKAYSAEVLSSLERVELMLDSVQAAFEKQLSNLLRDDMLDLDTEIAVLEETIEMEGA